MGTDQKGGFRNSFMKLFPQVCVTSVKHGLDRNVHFIPVKTLDVSQKANSLGFTKRIEFTDLNVAKFYKVIEEPGKPYWYHYRICAQNGGTTPIVYNAEMANVSGFPNSFIHGDQTGCAPLSMWRSELL